MYALRKSFGAYSAGTAVDTTDGYFHIGDVEVPDDIVVKRRNMTRMVPTINSRERRRRIKAEKRALGI